METEAAVRTLTTAITESIKHTQKKVELSEETEKSSELRMLEFKDAFQMLHAVKTSNPGSRATRAKPMGPLEQMMTKDKSTAGA